MIDVFCPEGCFSEEHSGEVLRRLTEAFLKWTDASEIPIARDNTGAFLHVFPAACVTAGGEPARAVRIDVKVPNVVLSTIERRRGLIADASEIVATLASAGQAPPRAWVTISNTADGGWGISGRGFTNAELDEI